MEQQKMNVDLKNTTAIKSEEGNQIFQEGFLLRKISRFITGQAKDGIVPIPVFFDIATGRPLKDTLPSELWGEFGYSNEVPEAPGTLSDGSNIPQKTTPSSFLSVVK